MIKADLITGFLGSGKTTFLKKYARYLLDTGRNIGILENDFGAVNVDMMLLQELSGDHCELSMVAGGCDPDCHRRRFKTKLISLGMMGYDRILIEPSGIFDVDEFFDVLQEEPLNRWYEIGNVIAVVDAGLERDLSVQSEFFLASQIATAGKVVFSKIQETEREDVLKTVQQLDAAMERVRCSRQFSDKDIMLTDWNSLTEQDWRQIEESGYRPESYIKLSVTEHNDYGTLYYMNEGISTAGLEDRLNDLMHDPSCGNIFRIKGFVSDQEGHWFEINATKKNTRIGPIGKGQEVFIVIGEDLNKERIDRRIRD